MYRFGRRLYPVRHPGNRILTGTLAAEHPIGTLVAIRTNSKRGNTSTCITGQGLSVATFPVEPPLLHGAAFADLILKSSKAEKR